MWAWLTSRNTLVLTTGYLTKYGRSMSNGMGVRSGPKKFCVLGPRLFESGTWLTR